MKAVHPITPPTAVLLAPLRAPVLAAAATGPVGPLEVLDGAVLGVMLAGGVDVDEADAEAEADDDAAVELVKLLLLELDKDMLELPAAPEAVAEIPGPDPTPMDDTAAEPDAALTYQGMPQASATLSNFQPLLLAAGRAAWKTQ
jgi:hypothetical protein